MKKIVLIIGFAALASVPSFAKTSLLGFFDSRLDGLFGYKFGDRLPSNIATIPSGDGTLLAPIDPKKPEFAFQEYFVCVVPQTRVIVGFAAADTFADDEIESCKKAFARSKRVIEDRFGRKLVKLPSAKKELIHSQSVIQEYGLELADKRWVMLQIVKNNPGNYILRFIALNMNTAEGVVEHYMQEVKSLPPLDGLFGKRLGAQIPISDGETVLANGLSLQIFEPDKKFLDFSLYALQILPRSRKVCGILAVKDFEDRFSATECYTKVCRLLEMKFGQKLTDASSNFDSTKPDGDGEQMIKCAVLVFPSSLRFIEVHCFKDVDEKVFRVRILANDQALVSALESEKKAKDRDSDAKALDAL